MEGGAPIRYRLIRQHGKPVILGKKVHYVGGNLARAWGEVFETFGLEVKQWNAVLLMGMGASLIQLLAQSQHPPSSLLVLEIDSEMVRLQETHFRLPLPYKVVLGDAAQTIYGIEGSYDGIFIDVFIEDEVPLAFLCPPFVEAVRRRLAPYGLLFWNVLRRQESVQVGELLKQAFRVVRQWRYEGHAFWAAAHEFDAFPTPF
ncbi:MAG: hypothetical protein RMK19_01400 [Bacteroidia bacterium]|nr:hypothetical protein [Bacteroidia bacterium]MDW8014651.1 hypothetical protein [Bacteroidia bacterium]